MSDTLIKVDPERAKALEDAVSAGDAASVQAAVESALDAWLVEQALVRTSDTALQALWRDGVDSGEAAELDVASLKLEARDVARTP